MGIKDDNYVHRVGICSPRSITSALRYGAELAEDMTCTRL